MLQGYMPLTEINLVILLSCSGSEWSTLAASNLDVLVLKLYETQTKFEYKVCLFN